MIETTQIFNKTVLLCIEQFLFTNDLKTTKQIVSFLLIAILLSSTVGLSINEHYCQESLVVTSIGMDTTTPCTCEIPMPEDCCQDVSTFYALISNFSITQPTISSQPTFVVLNPIKFKAVAIAYQPLNFNVFKDTIYPLAEPKVYLKVQSFLL